MQDDEEAQPIHQRASMSDAYQTSLLQVTQNKLKYDIKSVLIVDDDPMNIMGLEVVLKKAAGITTQQIIRTAGNGKKAFEMCQEQMPQLIFMDINMPIMGGYEATKLIKQLGQTTVIAVTGDSPDDIRQEATEAGMDLIIGKPAHIDSLRAVLDQIMKN